jgi:hypothetical protein
MMRIPGGAKAISRGAASMPQMTDAVLAKLEPREHSHLAPELVASGRAIKRI